MSCYCCCKKEADDGEHRTPLVSAEAGGGKSIYAEGGSTTSTGSSTKREPSQHPMLIQVKGRVGMNNGVNGIYKRGHYLHEGRHFYHKENTGWVIRYHARRKQWIFDRKGLRKSGRGVCKATEGSAMDPTQVTSTWRVFDGKNSVEDKDIQVVPATAESLSMVSNVNSGTFGSQRDM